MFKQFKRFIWKASLLGTFINLLVYTIALAASGDLDPTFDGDGLVATDFALWGPDDSIGGIAIQANGKIVAAGRSSGNFAVARYNTNGSLDAAFSGDGRLATNFGADESAQDVALQSNGKIVVAGQRCTNGPNCNVAIARYNTNGTLDTAFSGDGKVTTDYGGGDNGLSGLVLQSDGKIVVAGYMWNGTNYDFAIYRYNTDGSLDITFSGDGREHINFGVSRHDFANDLVIQSDGKIVLAGYTADASSYFDNNFAIARLNANGTVDTSFSGNGWQTTNFGEEEYANALALQPNGKIVVVGEKTNTTTYISFALARYNTDGSLDTTFNGTGRKVFTIIPGMHSWARDVIVQSDGKIVVVGATSNSDQYFDVALVRLNPGGAFDIAFSGDGKVTVGYKDFDDVGIALAIDPLNGKYVLGGYTDFDPSSDFALARVLP